MLRPYQEVVTAVFMLLLFTLFVALPVWVLSLSAPTSLFTASAFSLAFVAAAWSSRDSAPTMPLYFGILATCFAAAGAAALRFPGLVPAPPLAGVELNERSFQIVSLWVMGVLLMTLFYSCRVHRKWP